MFIIKLLIINQIIENNEEEIPLFNYVGNFEDLLL